MKSIEKKNKINEIDEHIRRNFDIKKVSGRKDVLKFTGESPNRRSCVDN